MVINNTKEKSLLDLKKSCYFQIPDKATREWGQFIGELRKSEFVKRANECGANLIKEAGRSRTLYKNLKNNNLVSITYAAEDKNPNKWWLGLKYKNQNCLVFICINDLNEATNFIVPKSFIEKYKKDFSKNTKTGGLEFNISLNAGIYYLNIPGKRPAVIDNFINAFDNL